MREGWYGDNYLILFDESEVPSASERYAISTSLPGYQVLGLSGWDDFIVRSAAGQTYSVPTVPVDERYLTPFHVPDEPSVTPIRFAVFRKSQVVHTPDCVWR